MGLTYLVTIKAAVTIKLKHLTFKYQILISNRLINSICSRPSTLSLQVEQKDFKLSNKSSAENSHTAWVATSTANIITEVVSLVSFLCGVINLITPLPFNGLRGR